MARSRSSNGTNGSTAHLGFEAKLWLAADKLRSNMDAAEYKHVVLGLIFLKYISDTFEEHRAKQPAIGKIVDDAMVALERDNPPFNDCDWFRKDDDVRWQFGVPPKGNANFAWVQHFIHLAPHGSLRYTRAAFDEELPENAKIDRLADIHIDKDTREIVLNEAYRYRPSQLLYELDREGYMNERAKAIALPEEADEE